MNKNEKPIPVRSVVILPRWLMLAGVALCVGLMLGCIALIVYGLAFVEGPGRWGYVGGAIGGFLGCCGGLYGTLADWHRRLPATFLLAHVLHDKPSPFYRVFWPALAGTIVGLGLACIWNERAIWQGLVQTCGLLALMSGVMERIRRHTTKQARALFALYADGALDAADAAAIDDARTKDAKFDAEVRAFQAVGEQLRRLTGGAE